MIIFPKSFNIFDQVHQANYGEFSFQFLEVRLEEGQSAVEIWRWSVAESCKINQ